MLCLSITISFSGISFTSHFMMTEKLDKMLTQFSLGMYVCQVSCGTPVQWLLPDQSILVKVKVIVYFSLLIPLAILDIIVVDRIKDQLRKMTVFQHVAV